MRFTHLFLALALIIGLSNVAKADGDFTKSAIQMGTSYCTEASFDCDQLKSSQSEIVAAANACVAQRFNISENVMSNFRMSGEYENCVLSDRAVKNQSGFNVWAVCCVKKAGDEGKCEMNCTRYVDQKQN
ncbi:MAG: hypothetical protein SFW65_03275 [Alphaproteobacteria bacterium]|nr:hypothetical protein [Alphaproteobacteria bacterium]